MIKAATSLTCYCNGDHVATDSRRNEEYCKITRMSPPAQLGYREGERVPPFFADQAVLGTKLSDAAVVVCS